MKIPLKDGSTFDLTPYLAGFKARHPHIADWPAELAKMHLWLARNPSRRPASPYRFVDNWCKKVKFVPVKLRIVEGRMSEQELLALGTKLGIKAYPGESWTAFAGRIQAKSA
jgi:hypothetical protein